MIKAKCLISDNQQITDDRRYQISALLERGISVSEIAKTVQCHHSAAFRELAVEILLWRRDLALKSAVINKHHTNRDVYILYSNSETSKHIK